MGRRKDLTTVGNFSLFTRFLIEGIETGNADQNQHGEITVNELYRYIYDNVVRIEPSQKPQIYTLGQTGDIVMARNAKRAQISTRIQSLAKSADYHERMVGILKLDELINVGEVDADLSKTAIMMLEQLSRDPNEQVASQAQQSRFNHYNPDKKKTMQFQTGIQDFAAIANVDTPYKDMSRPDVFLNYASNDRPFAKELYEFLKKNGFDVWFDRENIEGGDEWQREINNGLRRMEIMVSILTKESSDPMRNHPNRNWIFYEQEQSPKIYLFRFCRFISKNVIFPNTCNKFNLLISPTQRTDKNPTKNYCACYISECPATGYQSSFDETPNLSRPFKGRQREMRESDLSIKLFKVIFKFL